VANAARILDTPEGESYNLSLFFQEGTEIRLEKDIPAK
jgi:hypothetical protein